MAGMAHGRNSSARKKLRPLIRAFRISAAVMPMMNLPTMAPPVYSTVTRTASQNWEWILAEPSNSSLA